MVKKLREVEHRNEENKRSVANQFRMVVTPSTTELSKYNWAHLSNRSFLQAGLYFTKLGQCFLRTSRRGHRFLLSLRIISAKSVIVWPSGELGFVMNSIDRSISRGERKKKEGENKASLEDQLCTKLWSSSFHVGQPRSAQLHPPPFPRPPPPPRHTPAITTSSVASR